jgi:hypothetical protein
MVLYCNRWTSWKETVSSGRANDVVSGGRANAVATGNVLANIRTHTSAGSVVFRAQGSHATVSLVHRQVRSARSSCFWGYVLRIPGENQIHCHWRRAWPKRRGRSPITGTVTTRGAVLSQEAEQTYRK